MALTKPTSTQLDDSILNFLGTVGNDTIQGTGDDDIITGGNVNNIDSGANDGVDTLQGFAGNDVYVVKGDADVIIEVADQGIDTVWASGTRTLEAEVENIGATQNAAATTLTGNAKSNILDGSGSTGVNTLVGLAGSDTYFLGTGDKVTEAAAGGTQDTVSAAFTIDLTNGTATGIGAGATAATTVANIENIILTGATAINATGNNLNNQITGNSGNNTLIGGLGNDILDTGFGGSETLNGGAGDDTYIIRSTSTLAVAIADSAGANDLVNSYISVDVSTLAGGQGIEKVTLLGSAFQATGNTLNNILTGNALSNDLFGGAGNDTLIGGAALSFNILDGGLGNDIYVVTDANDVIQNEVNSVAGGVDAVQYGGTDVVQTFTMGNFVENLTMTGTANLRATGNASINNMTGNTGNNTLSGGDGNDLINGGNGDDTLNGDAGNDSLTGGIGDDTINGGIGNDTLNAGTAATVAGNTLDGGAGADTYQIVNAGDTLSETTVSALAAELDTVQFSGTVAASVLTVGANIENITLLGVATIGATVAGTTNNHTMTGNSAANALTGGDGIDTINGGAGADTMTGNGGNDVFTVDVTGDVAVGGAGTDTVNSAATYTIEATVENLNLVGALAINGTGNAANNVINGNAAANTIVGNGGNDTINAGVGIDTITTTTGDDTITGGSGKDTVVTGTGSDILKFAAGVADTVSTASSIAGVDLYSDIDLGAAGVSTDKIDVTGLTVANVGTAVSGSVSVTGGLFIAGMNSLLVAPGGAGFNTTVAGTITAAVVNVTGGELINRSFLAIDLDGSDTFTATDFVIEVTGGANLNSLEVGNFL